MQRVEFGVGGATGAQARGIETGAPGGGCNVTGIFERFLAFPHRAAQFCRQPVGVLAFQLGGDHQPRRHNVVAREPLGLEDQGTSRTSRQRFSSIIR